MGGRMTRVANLPAGKVQGGALEAWLEKPEKGWGPRGRAGQFGCLALGRLRCFLAIGTPPEAGTVPGASALIAGPALAAAPNSLGAFRRATRRAMPRPLGADAAPERGSPTGRDGLGLPGGMCGLFPPK